MGVTYLEKSKLDNEICNDVKIPSQNLLQSSSGQEPPVLEQICSVKGKKSGKRKQCEKSSTNNIDPISWSKVYTSPAVAKRRRYKDIDEEIGESAEVKTTLYSLDKISTTDTAQGVPKERGDCAAAETQTIVSSATLKLIEKPCILNRISLPKFGCFCCGNASNNKAPSIHDADSFESIDITTPQSPKISTFNSTISNIARHSHGTTTAKRTKFNVKVAQILNKVTLKKYRKTSKDLLKSFKTFSYDCNV